MSAFLSADCIEALCLRCCVVFPVVVLHGVGVVMLLRELHKQAQLEGGAVYMINGNHESLNVSGNFR